MRSGGSNRAKSVIAVFAIAISVAAMYILFSQPAQDSQMDVYRSKCISACMATKSGKGIDNGPCLLNSIDGSDWVCDVAHDPRQDVDNLHMNQCPAFLSGTASHFIELNMECEIIRIS